MFMIDVPLNEYTVECEDDGYVDREKRDEEHEVDVVNHTDTVIQPWTMVVHALNAPITNVTVF